MFWFFCSTSMALYTSILNLEYSWSYLLTLLFSLFIVSFNFFLLIRSFSSIFYCTRRKLISRSSSFVFSWALIFSACSRWAFSCQPGISWFSFHISLIRVAKLSLYASHWFLFSIVSWMNLCNNSSYSLISIRGMFVICCSFLGVYCYGLLSSSSVSICVSISVSSCVGIVFVGCWVGVFICWLLIWLRVISCSISSFFYILRICLFY